MRFEGGTEAELDRYLAAAPAGQPVNVLLHGSHWGPNACRILARARPRLALHFIGMEGAAVGDAGLEELVRSPSFATVRNLSIQKCGVTDAGVRVLARSPYAANLEELYLSNPEAIATGTPNDISDVGAMALAESASLARLVKLNLWLTGVGDRGFEAIAGSTRLAGLRTLWAWNSKLTREGAERVKAAAKRRDEAITDRVAYLLLHHNWEERSDATFEG